MIFVAFSVKCALNHEFHAKIGEDKKKSLKNIFKLQVIV